MKITVLNGSPKGSLSVTMQYIHYLQKKFPQHELKITDISLRIKKIERDSRTFQDILAEIDASDGVIWATPVYYLLVPANYKRFIELVFARKADNVFKQKYAASLTTSIHFFDHTAHNYLHAVSEDLKMKFVASFSANMYDLRRAKERDKLFLFAENFFDMIKNDSPVVTCYPAISVPDYNYLPGTVKGGVEVGGKKMLIVTDAEDKHSNLSKMVNRFKSSFITEIETVNLHDLAIKGSCLGCIQCSYDNRCVYEGKDDFISFYESKIMDADILIYAGSIQDRYLSSTWKTFFDRSFFRGHTPSLLGKQIGFIISGPLGQIPNLRQLLTAYIEIQHANLAGFVTDESGDLTNIDSLLQNLANRIVRFAEKGYISPPTFLGVGGTKLFRDEIWGHLRFPFRADYLTFKKLGVFDFPQKRYKSRFRNRIMLILSQLPGFRKEVNRRMKKEMVKPLENAIEA